MSDNSRELEQSLNIISEKLPFVLSREINKDLSIENQEDIKKQNERTHNDICKYVLLDLSILRRFELLREKARVSLDKICKHMSRNDYCSSILHQFSLSLKRVIDDPSKIRDVDIPSIVSEIDTRLKVIDCLEKMICTESLVENNKSFTN